MPVKLSKYAKNNGISYKTAWRAFKSGKLKEARQLPSGAIVVDEEPRLDRLESAIERLENLCEKLGV